LESNQEKIIIRPRLRDYVKRDDFNGGHYAQIVIWALAEIVPLYLYANGEGGYFLSFLYSTSLFFIVLHMILYFCVWNNLIMETQSRRIDFSVNRILIRSRDLRNNIKTTSHQIHHKEGDYVVHHSKLLVKFCDPNLLLYFAFFSANVIVGLVLSLRNIL